MMSVSLIGPENNPDENTVARSWATELLERKGYAVHYMSDDADIVVALPGWTTSTRAVAIAVRALAEDAPVYVLKYDRPPYPLLACPVRFLRVGYYADTDNYEEIP